MRSPLPYPTRFATTWNDPTRRALGLLSTLPPSDVHLLLPLSLALPLPRRLDGMRNLHQNEDAVVALRDAVRWGALSLDTRVRQVCGDRLAAVPGVVSLLDDDTLYPDVTALSRFVLLLRGLMQVVPDWAEVLD